ncbi:MAG: Spy/CpxP family protein refolding chaperone [Ignavibacteriales bacterium]|nr:Spy/CpxP family protein refolding chaperone [Ignavibacteriales bacterium]
MKKRITIYLIVIVTLINLSSLGTIIYLKWMAANNASVSILPENRFESIKQELKLTPQQIEQFEKIRTEFHSKLDTLDTKFESLRKEMLKEIWQSEVSSQKLEGILEQFSRQQVESQRWVVQHFYQFKKVLTPEQSEKFYKILTERFQGQQRNPGINQMPNRKKDCE